MTNPVPPVAFALSILLMSPWSTKTNAQTPAPARPRLPLVSALSEAMFLQKAAGSSERAKALEKQNDRLGAVQEYERLIEESAGLSPDLQHTYEFYMVVAGAHLDAARARMDYSVTLSDQKLREQNQTYISRHLKQVPALVIAAKDVATAGDQHFVCEAYKLLGSGRCLLGIVNQSSPDLLSAIEALKHVETCDPSVAAQTREMISYAKRLEADISNRIFRADNIAKMFSKIVSISVPKVGGYLAGALDIAWDSHKEKENKKAVPRGPR
jgi:hypothetical protein